MRKLKKSLLNVENAELYALEKTGKNGKTLYGVTCVSEDYFDYNRPFHQDCKTGGRCDIYYDLPLDRAIKECDKLYTEYKTCGYVLYINGVYYGMHSTAYHAWGYCEH